MKRVGSILVLVHICPISGHSRNMNTVVAASSSAGVYTYIRLYMYIMLYFTYTLSISYVRIRVYSTVVSTVLLTERAL